MKVLTVVGARPQFIKAAPVSRALRDAGHTEFLVHTGQHYDQQMSSVFFEEMQIPEPDINLEVGSGSHAQQTGQMLVKLEEVMQRQGPDCVLVYGDTNSTAGRPCHLFKLTPYPMSSGRARRLSQGGSFRQNSADHSATKVANQDLWPPETGNATANYAALGPVDSGCPNQRPGPNWCPVLPVRERRARTLRSLRLRRRLPHDTCPASQAAPAGEVAERDPGRR